MKKKRPNDAKAPRNTNPPRDAAPPGDAKPAPDPQPPIPPPPTTAKPRSRWPRRLLLSLIALFSLVIIARLLTALLLPMVIDRVARIYGLDCTYDRLTLSILGGNAEIWDVQLTPREGGEPILRADYCQGEISVFNLLRGRLVVYRVATDGVDINIERARDGSLPLLARFISATSSANQPSATTTTIPPAIDLQPPLRIDALRLAHIRVRFDDKFVTPNFLTSVSLDMRLTDFGVLGKPTQFEMDFSSDPMLDSMQVLGEGQSDGQRLSAKMTVLMRGLHVKPAAAYLASVGLRPTADDIDASMSANLRLNIPPNSGDGLSAVLTLDHAHVSCDGEEAAAMDHLSMFATSITSASANFGGLEISGVRCNATRATDGALSAFGLEYAPAPRTSPEPKTALTLPNYTVRLARFFGGDIHARFADDSVNPPVTLALDVNRFAVDNPIPDSSHPLSPIAFSATLAAPGMVRTMQLTGQATPFAADKSFKLAASADGIALSAIHSYLAPLGLTSEWKDGSLRLAVNGTLSQSADGKLTASAHVSDFHLTDPDALLTLNDASIGSAGFDPRTATIHAAAIDISGPAVSIRRDSSGNLHALGFGLNLQTTTSSANSSGLAELLLQEIAEGRSGPIALIPNLDITHFAWKDIKLNLVDETVQPPTSLAVSDAGLTVENFVFPPTIPAQGAVHAWLKAPDFAPNLTLDGTLASAPHHITLESDVHGDGLRAGALAAYLKPLGVTPTLKNGSLAMHEKFEITSGPAFSLEVRDASLTDGGESLLGCSSLQIAALRGQRGGIALDAVRMTSPSIRIARDADGSIEVAGVSLAVKGEQSPFAPVYAFGAQGTPLPLPTLNLKQLQIQDASLHWIDNAVTPVVDTTANLSADMNDFDFGPTPTPATLHAQASVSGSLDSLTAEGTISASPDRQALNVTVAAQGIRAGTIASYLPPQVRVVLSDGHLHAAIALDAQRHTEGGRGIDLIVNDLGLQEGAENPALLDFASLHLKVARLDPAAKLIALDDLTLNGLDVPVHVTSTGATAAGVQWIANPGVAPSTQPTTTSPAATTAPVLAPLQTTASSSPPESSQDILKQIAAERDRLPLIELNNLDLNCNSITVTYDSPENPAPAIISNLRVHNTAPLTFLGRDIESNPATELDLTGQVEPVADAFKIHIHATPFLRQKTLGVDFLVSGIHGAGLAAVAPGLMRGVDPAGLKSGQVSGSVTTSLRLQNVRQTDFSFAYGGKLDFSLKDLKFQGESQGPVLAGVQEIHSENVLLGPNFATVQAPELNIENISGQATREKDGVHFAGLIIPLPKPSWESPSSDEPAAPKSTAVTNAPVATNPAANSISTDSSSSVISVDRLLISGMNFRMEDHTVDPPFIVPINGLDVEAQGLSNLVLSQNKPIRFSALINSDKVAFAPSNGKSTALNERPLFSQIASNGVVSLSPNLKGWAKASVSGFELASLGGVAKQHDVTLGGGTFDGDLDLRFPGDGTIDTSSRLVLTDLSLSEPPNGNLSHALSLPAPLDVVIGALEDPDGSITLPLNIDVRQGQLDSGSVAAAASGAFLGVVATAVATSPIKAVNLFGSHTPQQQVEPPVILAFPAGYPTLSSDQIAALTAMKNRLLRSSSLELTIRNELGSDDIALAAERVNPGASDATDLADALNRRRDELLAARRTASSDVRALLASTATDEANSAIERLRRIDRELADMDNALDHIYDLLRPGADRQATRRTRQASLEIAAARLQAVRELLLLPVGKKKIDPERIHLTNAPFTDSPGNESGQLSVVVVQTK